MRVFAVALLLGSAAAAEGESRLGSLIRWYLREESPARRQGLLDDIERLAQGDPRPVADAIRNGEHFDHPEHPVLKTGGKQPVFDLRRPRVQPVDDCAGDLSELVLPEGYTPSRAHPLLVELAPTGLAPPKDAILLRVHVAAHPQARTSAEAADLLVMSLLAHVTELVHVDPRRIFLFAGGREEAALAWCIALHDPDRFAGLLAGPGAWKEGIDLAPNGALFSSVGIVNRKGDRSADAFLEAVEQHGASHLRLEMLGDREQDRAELVPKIDAWFEACSRPPRAPRRIRLVDDRGSALRAYWLRLAPRVPSLKAEDVGRTWTQRVLAQPATLEAEFKEKDLVVVRADHVAAFDLFVDPALLELGSVVRVTINGAVPEARVVRGDIGTLLDDYKERRDADLLYWGRLTFTVR